MNPAHPTGHRHRAPGVCQTGSMGAMLGLVVEVCGGMAVVIGSWRSYAVAREALAPLAHDGDPTRTEIESARPFPMRPRVRLFARRVAVSLAWLGGRVLRALPDRRRAGRATMSVETATSAAERYEAVIGIEVHCQLRTASKMFCACSTDYDGAPPNSHTCPVCLGLPGALPTINRAAVEGVLATGAAIGATTPEATRWDRKNYFYPDLPKGYQISQYDLPLAAHGRLTIETSEGPFTIGITRAHLEEDTAKLIHATDPQRAQGQPRRLQPLGRAAHGDRHRSGPPDRRAGPSLRRGAPAPAPDDRRVRRGHGARPDAGRGQRLDPPPGHDSVRDPGRGQEHELVPLGGAGDRLRDRAPGGRPRRRARRSARTPGAGTMAGASPT